MASEPIPVIDLSRARCGEPDGTRSDVAAQLVKALEEVGFIYLDGVDGGPDWAELRRAADWFFSLPAGEKMAVTKKQWNPQSPNIYRGRFPAQGAVSHKEALEIGIDSLSYQDPDVERFVLYEPNLWPNEEGGDGFEPFPNFRATLVHYFETMSQTALDVIRLIATGLGLDEHHFDELFLVKPLSTLRLLHYPPRDGPPPPEAFDGDAVLQCEAHCDNTILTILCTFEFGGLQVLTQDGRWCDIPPRANSLVMNIGKMLSHMSRGRLKATVHRVKVTDPDRARFSMPFFLEPRYQADIGKFLPQENGSVDEGCMRYYGPWLIRNMSGYVEYKDVDFGNYMDVDVN